MKSDSKAALCYSCEYRREVPGNAHSRCAHPAIPQLHPVTELAAMLGGGPPLRCSGITVRGTEHGIRMGWFFWPLNFDPVWLEECDGYRPAEKEQVRS